MPVDLRVIRALAILVVEEQPHHYGDQHHAAKNRQPLHLRIRKPLRRFFLQRHFFDHWPNFCRVFQPYFDLNAHRFPSLRVNFFHLPNRTRIVRARLIEPVERRDLVVVRARQ